MTDEENTVKIGIISDTHDLLRQEVVDQLMGCDEIIHCGDISSPVILDKIREIGNVHAIRGNADKGWGEELPLVLDITLHGIRICAAHKKKDLPEDLSPFDVVMTGHTHKYEAKKVDNILFLNPGSCGPRKPSQPITMAILHISDGNIEAEKIDILHAAADNPSVEDSPDLKKLIQKVIKDTGKKKTVEEISRKRGADTGLVEKIVRLYLTHPGIDADGIMEKMGCGYAEY